MTEWISVKDRLPIIGIEVLTYHKMFGYIIQKLYDIYGDSQIMENLGWSEGGICGSIEYWMPLPNPPENL